MLVAHIGIDTFLKGVSLYLKRHLYANAESADLWMALSETSGIDVADLLKEWISKVTKFMALSPALVTQLVLSMQPGFPVIKVAKAEGGVKVTQSRFRECPPLVDVEQDDETTWFVDMIS
jgi:aminopeptidase 2